MFTERLIGGVSSGGGRTGLAFVRNGRVETEISCGQLHEDSNRAARLFLDRGVTKGDRVVLCMEKSVGFVVAYLGVLKTGAVAVPLNPGFREAELAYLVGDAQPRLAVAGPDQERTLGRAAPSLPLLVIPTETPYQDCGLFRGYSPVPPALQTAPQDPCLIIYTSGTTGKPKGAVLTQKNLAHDAGNIIAAWEMSSSDVLCHALPLFHIHGLCFALHTALICGARVLITDRFSPGEVLDLLALKDAPYRCSIFMAVPTMYVGMLDLLGKRRPDFGHVRLWTSGSAALSPRDFVRIRETFGKEPVEREGMSETGMNFSNPLRGLRKPGSVGLPLPGLRARIVDPDTGADVPSGTVGEIVLRGPGITHGYWHKPEETEAAFRDGWFRTGDLGRVDGDGYFYLTDRLKHIIISGGENISPKEVETVMNTMDGVLESSVVGVADAKWGEKVVAGVVLRSGSNLTPQGILDFCRKHLHPWKCPKEVVLLEELPRNSMGKVLKERVRERMGKS